MISWTTSAFEARVEKIPMAGCWIWLGYLSKGYGQTRIGYESVKAHRLSYTLFKGSIPLGLNILHRCDIKCCVNPEHLYAGTQSDNGLDAVDRGLNVQANKTHCVKGHPLFGANLYLRPDGRGRECRICAKYRADKYAGRIPRRIHLMYQIGTLDNLE